jgi:uncharacterized protein (DUF58 family)
VRTSLVAKVASKMFIFAHRRVRTMLDGEYGAVFRGRSLDFDDLRAYAPGDEIRDIDWKASARVGAPLVRRYAAVRKQTVVLVADTGRGMAAVSRSGEPKREIMLMALGVMGYLAYRHGDQLALVAGDSSATAAHPPRTGQAHLEQILRRLESSAGTSASRSDLTAQLAHVARTVRRRGLLVVVADEAVLDDEDEALLARLAVQHEILWITVLDAELVGAAAPRRSYDVDGGALLLGRLAAEEEVVREYGRLMAERTERRERILNRLGIVEGRLGSVDEVLPGIFRLLERHRRAR